MIANELFEETRLVDGAMSFLVNTLPSDWTVEQGPADIGPADRGIDGIIDVRSTGGGTCRIVVVAKQKFGPRDVDQLFGGLGRSLLTMAGRIPVLVVSPWLSELTRSRLAEQGVNYFDLTGNALVRIDYPTIFIKTDGAARNPSPTPRGKARVQGPKAGRLIRTLVDCAPPYGVGDLASSTGLALGYVSRLLDSLYEEGLIERGPRGRVDDVRYPELLLWWSQSYDLIRANKAASFIAPRGVRDLLNRLPTGEGRIAVTGSFAAVRKAPVAAPSLLVVYSGSRGAIAEQFGLISSTEATDVLLLEPFDRVVWERTEIDGDIEYVAPSQVVVDCLSGTGRMPAEGEALIRWMVENESSWRVSSLPGSQVE
jgi:hypothetical protein